MPLCAAQHSYANDLEDLAHYYKEYSRLLAHWRSTLRSRPHWMCRMKRWLTITKDGGAGCYISRAFLGIRGASIFRVRIVQLSLRVQRSNSI